MDFFRHMKNRLVLLIPALLLYATAFGPKAQAAGDGPALDVQTLFTQAERELETLADLSGAERVSVADGQDVTINAAGVWILDGAASEVTVSVDAPEDAAVYLLLRGVRIDNRDRPCVYVGCAGTVYLQTLEDSSLTVREEFRKDSGKKANAVIYSRADLTLGGKAALTVDSPKNGILCKGTLRVLGGEYAVTAGSKAIAADNAVWVAGGDFRLRAETDGIHAENEDDDTQGSVYIGGGSLEIDVGDDGIHGHTLVRVDDGSLSISADEGIESTWVLLNGGSIDIRAIGDGVNAGHKSEAYRPKIEITGGSLYVTMNGKDSDALDSNADLVISGGTVSVNGAGIDWDGKLYFTGGTVIIEGESVSEIPNASTHSLETP